MKKTISINISGVIFHIEEDGYEKLKSYLQSIQQYFSTYDDSQEIVTDIENRIAEKLLKSLKGDDKTPSRQAVTLEDVNGLIAKMGTVADFEAVENEEVLATGGSRAKANSGTTPPLADVPGKTQSTNAPPPGTSYSYKQGNYEYDYQRDATTGKTQTSYSYRGRKLARDLRRKTLGGVAAGLAHYFQIDPVWMRVLFVSLVIVFPVLGSGVLNGDDSLFGSLWGVSITVYILLWIFLPGDGTMEEEKGIKKFYRNPDNKVLGGVASGLGAYFGVEASIIRIAMVVSVFVFGFGILAYIVLWMVAPEARSLTEKMEMTGKPITLVNIESSVKSNLNVPEHAPESGLTQLLLFPFRAIATIFRALGQLFGKTLGGLGSVIRVLFGLLMLLIGFSFAIAMLTTFGAGVGILASTNIGPGEGLPISVLREDAPFITLLAGFVFGFLPSLALTLTGLMVIARKSFISGNAVLTLLAAWVISGVILGTTVPHIVRQFSRNGTAETSSVVRIAGTPTFAIRNLDDADFQESPRIELMGYNGTEIKLVKTASSRGETRGEAETSAREIQYAPVMKDSIVEFNDEFVLPNNVRYRKQDLNVIVYIPFGKPFRMTSEFGRYITNRFDNKELDAMPNNLWQFTPTGLTGIGFERTLDRDDDNKNTVNRTTNGDDDEEDDVDVDTDGNERQSLLTNPATASALPTTVSISGNFGVRFQKGSSLKVMADGSNEEMNKITLTNEEGILRIEQRNSDNPERIGLTITLPSLETLRLSGTTEARLTEFDALNTLTVDLSGSSKAFVKTTAKTLTTDQTGASRLILRGRADEVIATLSGASRLQASQVRVEKADINASGASNARFGRVPKLTAKTTGLGKIDHESGQ